MTLTELAQLLESNSVPPDALSTGDRPKDESWVVAENQRGWTFYYSERGHRNSERHFATEDEVCRYAASEILYAIRQSPRTFD